MSTIFGITEDKMKETSSTFTLTEIYQQPATWEKTCRQIEENKEELQKFIDQVIKCDDFDVIPIGGGIGQSRLCMLLLGSVHIGEVQASVWDKATREACAKAGIPLL